MAISRRLLTKYKDEATAPALEVMGHLYMAITALPKFTLKDGSQAQVDIFIPPHIDKDGDVRCSFDVNRDDGSHMEFTVQNTGWGKFVQQATQNRKRGDGRTR